MMGISRQYAVTLTGRSPLIMRRDNPAFEAEVTAWRKAPANKWTGLPGDDRDPAWRWIGHLCHDGKVLGIPVDDLLVMLHDGEALAREKVAGRRRRTVFSGIKIEQQWPLTVNGQTISYPEIAKLFRGHDSQQFSAHVERVEKFGFELLVRRVPLPRPKHIRVRPFFRTWTAAGTLTILDEEISGLTLPVLDRILEQAGDRVGLCDWRPSSPSKPGSFGRFAAEVKLIA